MLRMLMADFWPIILPLVFYLGYMFAKRRRAKRKGEEIPPFLKGHAFWVIVATMAVAIACFVALGLSSKPLEGVYDPAHLQDGKMVPGKIVNE